MQSHNLRKKLLTLIAAFLIANVVHGDNKLYWTNRAGGVANAGTVQVGNQCGIEPPSSLFLGETSPVGVSIYAAGNKIYWGASTGVRIANLDGSGFVRTLYSDSPVIAVAVDPVQAKIYWINSSGAIKVAKLNGNGAISTLFSDEGASALTIDQTRIYWTNENGQIKWGLKSGGTISVLFENESTPVGIALDQGSQTLYWTNSVPGGAVRAGPFTVVPGATAGTITLQAGEVKTVYSDENTPRGISLDRAAQKIYWANFATGDIRVGSFDGCVKPISLYSLQAEPSFPIILQAPVGLNEPQVFQTCEEDECENITLLHCSNAFFAGDDYPAFLYRTGVIRYSWFLNGLEVADSLRNSFAPECPGNYSCEARSTNPAGVCTMSSDSVNTGNLSKQKR